MPTGWSAGGDPRGDQKPETSFGVMVQSIIGTCFHLT